MNGNKTDLGRAVSSIHIPEELDDIVINYITAVLSAQPDDIYSFSETYFRGLALRHEAENSDFENDESRENLFSPPMRRAPIIPEYYNPEEDESFEKNRKIYPKTDEERAHLKTSLMQSYLFKERTDYEITVLIDAFAPKEVDIDDVIIRQGDEGDLFYVIEYGKFNVYVGDELVNSYTDIGSFGELALMYNQPRSATIKATTKGKLWFIDRNTFRRSVTHVAHDTRKLYISFVENTPLLQELTEAEKYNLVEALTLHSFNDGDLIIKQGDEADCMYFVLEGEVNIKLSHDNETKLLKTCKFGDYFGELALLTKKRRAASAYAVGATVVAVLNVETFERVLGKCIDIMKRNSEGYMDTLKQAFSNESIDESLLRD